MNRSVSFLLLVATMMSAASAADDVMRAVSATYKITNHDSTATAFLVSRQDSGDHSQLILVTAAHVIEKMSGDECRIVLRRRRLDGSYERREIPIAIRADDQPLWTRHEKADVAALKVQLPEDHEVIPFDYTRILDESQCDDCQLQMGDDVWVLGYPAQLESSRSGFPVLRRGSVASFPVTPTGRKRTFMVDYSTFGGDSGGPVFMRTDPNSIRSKSDGDSSPKLVGLIHGQHRETTKSTTPNEERTVHRPMGLAIVVHAKFIRETIDRVK
ncbi:MAG: trypsin-like peptidase domain-containing protein [Pirellulaceae bacterium]|nr:trypsin-like peptidase domain-containing protein [Pirellulaceae bacterium]